MEGTTAVAYYRVSTQKQGRSGLGLDAQRNAVRRFAARRGLDVVDEFTEVETGTRKRRRVEIYKAIDATREHDAVLLIAKLDRLARNVAFISTLKESGVKFTAVDMPEASELTVGILAVVAEQEARDISERTRAALEVKRQRAGEWRVSNLDQAARERGAATMHQMAVETMQTATYTARILREQGMSLRGIAAELNANGYKTRRGKQFRAATVKRMLDRVAE